MQGKVCPGIFSMPHLPSSFHVLVPVICFSPGGEKAYWCVVKGHEASYTSQHQCLRPEPFHRDFLSTSTTGSETKSWSRCRSELARLLDKIEIEIDVSVPTWRQSGETLDALRVQKIWGREYSNTSTSLTRLNVQRQTVLPFSTKGAFLYTIPSLWASFGNNTLQSVPSSKYLGHYLIDRVAAWRFNNRYMHEARANLLLGFERKYTCDQEIGRPQILPFILSFD